MSLLKLKRNVKLGLFVQVILMSAGSAFAQSASVAGCTASSFVQGTDNNVIQAMGASYTPKCLKVKLGSVVTIQASAHHPLAAMADIDAPNPFASNEEMTTTQTRQMNQKGVFGYFCTAHGDSEGDGMAGAILVE